MSGHNDDNTGFFGNLKKAFTEKDWLTAGVFVAGILNIVLSFVSIFTGFTKGWLSIGLGFVIAAAAMYALDKTRNSAAIAGGIMGFLGCGFGLIYLFCVSF